MQIPSTPGASGLHITTATTNTPIASDVFLSTIVINCSNAGTSFTLTVRDKAGTPKNVVNALTLATSQNPLVINCGSIPMTGGIDVITGGTPGVVDVFLVWDSKLPVNSGYLP